MAKRTRYPGRPGSPRPAGSRPVAGSGSRAAAAPRGGLTEAEIARAAEIESELKAREQAAIADSARRRARSRVPEAIPGVAADAGTPLSVRAAHEYAYVARDVKRISITAIVMFAILAALWVLVNVGGVGLP